MTGTNLKYGHRRLPSRRGSEAFALDAGGLSFAAAASRFVDDSLAEIFLQDHKEDSTASIMTSQARHCAARHGCSTCSRSKLRASLLKR